uniref:Methyltransferase type 11 n=1 Tax=uncultured Thiotrichaceae bacterium TaxID=298394 RepID=A0A6S6UHL4_9GAMM|nr:MAG: Methyltransferase type 11 [uncultured Thiotrichaceae bacterium]
MKTTSLIDCRPLTAYCSGHIQGACSLPAGQLFERMHELPKRQQPLTLCGTEQDLAAAMDYLIDRGHTVAEQIIWTDQLKQQLVSEGLLETGSESAQLWQPAPLWQRFVEEIAPNNNIQVGKGLDIACGAGRDMVYLAKQGWQMTGIDRSEDSLQRVAVLAKHSGVEVETQQFDLETGADPFTSFEDEGFDLITVGRYLHRPLFPYIKRLLKPGGTMIYQTFMQGCENTEIGRPRNPAFLLKSGELGEIFADFDILLDKVEVLEDGRPVAAFIARCA